VKKKTRGFGVVALACLSVGAFGGLQAASASPTVPQNALDYLHAHGYLPIHGAETLDRAKAAAAVDAGSGPTAATDSGGGQRPTILASFKGVTNTGLSPLDANGAIGPSSYLEDINVNMTLYQRTGAQIATTTFSALTGHSSVSDPMALWDPATQRFYYNIWDTSDNSMAWGFSKTSNPTSFNNTFCNYATNFGYPAGSLTDYPKLGQSKDFLMIGVNWYKSPSNLHATQSDLLWINKPQGSAPVTTCPPASTFKSGKFTKLKNQDHTQAFTPVPAIQTDPSSTGYVTTMSDIECPDICGNGALMTEYTLTPAPGNPKKAQLSAPHSIKVPVYTSPPGAPQKGTSFKLDTLDGRLTHSVSGMDPRMGATTVWMAHTVKGGAGSEVRWYELNPAGAGTLVQTGSVSDPKLYVFNAGVSNDRTVTPTGAAHGSAMVVGVTTSSATSFATDQMASKIGAAAQSPLVKVHASATFDTDFTCSAAGTCRWGDYGGATPDPAASMTGATGLVWLTNMWTTGTLESWNWEAKP
jgi:hypothetical protein